MTAEKSYEQFIIAINKNAQTDSVHCDRGRFVVLYNKQQVKYLEHLLDRKNEDEIRYAENFVVPDESISVTSIKDNYTEFELPEDYFDFISALGKASTDYCTGATIDLIERKLESINELNSDEFNDADFDYREAPMKIANGKLLAYQKNFTYDNALVSYYRYPQEIALVNPDDPESQFDSNLDPEWDDKSNNKIIDRCAARFLLNNDEQKYQAVRQESITK